MSSVLTPVGTLCFADGLFKAKPVVPGSDKLRHNCILLLDADGVASSAYTAMQKAAHDAVVDKFGAAKAADPSFKRGLRSPFRPAAEKNYAGFEKGEVFIAPWCNPDSPPSIVNLQGEKIVVPGDVWSGQLARASVRFFAYDTNGNKGVGLFLEHVQIVKADMPRLDGKQSAEAAFSNADNSQLAALGIDPAAASAGASGGTPGQDDLPF